MESEDSMLVNAINVGLTKSEGRTSVNVDPCVDFSNYLGNCGQVTSLLLSLCTC